MAAAKSDSLVDYERDGAIVTLTLNRPEKLNAFSDELVGALSDALHRFDMDDAAQIAILNGRGRAFSSGADVQQRQLRSREEFLRLGGPQGRGTHSSDLLTKAVNWKPVIAAAHGYVLGLSVGIVLECDLVVAEEGTRFQVTETSRGLGAGKYWALMHYRGGGAFTMEAALTGRFFTAEEAFRANLINRVAARGKYLDVARELACELHRAHAALVHGPPQPRGHVPDGARAALSHRGLPGGRARLHREAQAQALQGPLIFAIAMSRSRARWIFGPLGEGVTGNSVTAKTRTGTL